MYAGIKHTHLLLLVISIVLFELRFLLKVVMKRPLNRFLKITPHVVDTLLLVSGITLAVKAGFLPSEQLWLTVKLIGVLFYIGFGIMALKAEGKASYIGFILATLSVAYIILVAITKNPLIV